MKCLMIVDVLVVLKLYMERLLGSVFLFSCPSLSFDKWIIKCLAWCLGCDYTLIKVKLGVTGAAQKLRICFIMNGVSDENLRKVSNI